MITAQAHIDLNALQHNYRRLKALSGSQQVVAVIKGDAYGHGAVQLASALPDADRFAVSRLEEAEELRLAGITQPILLLEGCFCADDLKRAAELKLDTTIHCEEQLHDLETSTLAHPIHVWLKVDTGMHRLGVQPFQVPEYVSRIERTRKLSEKLGFISHFSCADDINHPTTQRQLACFNQATAQYDGPKTIANSAGILFWPESQFDVARAGIALFGISPSAEHTGRDHALVPVMTLNTRLIAVRKTSSQPPSGLWRNLARAARYPHRCDCDGVWRRLPTQRTKWYAGLCQWSAGAYCRACLYGYDHRRPRSRCNRSGRRCGGNVGEKPAH